MINLGRHSYFTEIQNIWDAQVNIGNFTSIATLYLVSGHSVHACLRDRQIVPTFAFHERLGWDYPKGNVNGTDVVNIGSDVWIGYNVIFTKPITVGPGAIIGAGSVVTKDVKPYSVVVGNPAREIKQRFYDEQIEALLAIKWWDWEDGLIQARLPDLCNINEFINKYKLL